jgi:hypothetical protein
MTFFPASGPVRIVNSSELRAIDLKLNPATVILDMPKRRFQLQSFACGEGSAHFDGRGEERHPEKVLLGDAKFKCFTETGPHGTGPHGTGPHGTGRTALGRKFRDGAASGHSCHTPPLLLAMGNRGLRHQLPEKSPVFKQNRFLNTNPQRGPQFNGLHQGHWHPRLGLHDGAGSRLVCPSTTSVQRAPPTGSLSANLNLARRHPWCVLRYTFLDQLASGLGLSCISRCGPILHHLVELGPYWGHAGQAVTSQRTKSPPRRTTITGYG